MDNYPSSLVANNDRLIAISGLGAGSTFPGSDDSAQPAAFFGQGFKISTPAAPLAELTAKHLRSEFEAISRNDLRNESSEAAESSTLIDAEVILVGREYTFPSRKAAPAPQTPSASPPRSPSTPTSASIDLHSPLSPLSASSPLFPDGLLTAAWIAKHQFHIPAVLVFFVELISQPDRTLEDLDADLKAEILALKLSLSRAALRTRLAVVIVPSDASVPVNNAEQRLNDIRRATGLDAKTSFFYFPTVTSKEDCKTFATALLTALRPTCLEYYRDLTKHARRKRGRGFLPVPTSSRATTSLSTQAWNARYDFKMGVFAEFRREWDVAEKHYLSAADNVFDPDGPLYKSQPARRTNVLGFADVIAIRTIRCQLCRGLPTSAAEQWFRHRLRIATLNSRDGSLSPSTSLEAWDSQWTLVMAQLVERADLAAFVVRPNEILIPTPEEHDELQRNRDQKPFIPTTVFTVTDAPLNPNERQLLSRYLHHQGYWYESAAKKIEQAAGSSDDPKITSGSLSSLNQRAALAFYERQQYRASAVITIRQAQNLIQQGLLTEAFDVLQPLWQDSLWRRERWWSLFAEVLRLIHHTASSLRIFNVVADAEYEACCTGLSGLDITHSSILVESDASDVALSDQQRTSPVSITFAFANTQGFVGDTASCQLVLAANTFDQSNIPRVGPIVLIFDNEDKVTITHQKAEKTTPSPIIYVHLQAETGSPDAQNRRSFEAHADLSLSDKHICILNMRMPLQTAATINLAQATISSSRPAGEVEYTQAAGLHTSNWWIDTAASGPQARDRYRPNSHQLHVLSKPPRVSIQLPTMQQQYFTNERVRLQIDLGNEERCSVAGTLEITAIDRSAESPLRLVSSADDKDPSGGEDGVQGGDMMDRDEESSSQTVTMLQSEDTRAYYAWFNAPARASETTFAISITYNLEAEDLPSCASASSSCTRTLQLQMNFVDPFKISLELQPRFDEATWPSFFTMPVAQANAATGIKRSWLLRTTLTNTSLEALSVDRVTMVNDDQATPVVCSFDIPKSDDPRTVEPGKTTTVCMPFTTQAKTLEDHRAPSLAATIKVSWHRKSASSSSAATHTELVVPKYMVPPVEPRVLCTVKKRHVYEGIPQIVLVYTIENPSTHFLTFNVRMLASDEFAFRGPKNKSLSLTPISRTCIEYGLIVHDRKSCVSRERMIDGESMTEHGRWVKPCLTVVDAYFQKTLVILAADGNVRYQGDGGIEVWVTGD